MVKPLLLYSEWTELSFGYITQGIFNQGMQNNTFRETVLRVGIQELAGRCEVESSVIAVFSRTAEAGRMLSRGSIFSVGWPFVMSCIEEVAS